MTWHHSFVWCIVLISLLHLFSFVFYSGFKSFLGFGIYFLVPYTAEKEGIFWLSFESYVMVEKSFEIPFVCEEGEDFVFEEWEDCANKKSFNPSMSQRCQLQGHQTLPVFVFVFVFVLFMIIKLYLTWLPMSSSSIKSLICHQDHHPHHLSTYCYCCQQCNFYKLVFCLLWHFLLASSWYPTTKNKLACCSTKVWN